MRLVCVAWEPALAFSDDSHSILVISVPCFKGHPPPIKGTPAAMRVRKARSLLVPFGLGDRPVTEERF